jgi:hypothetical protein
MSSRRRADQTSVASPKAITMMLFGAALCMAHPAGGETEGASHALSVGGLRGSITLDQNFGGEYLRYDGRVIMRYAGRAKLDGTFQPHANVRLNLSLLGKFYSADTIVNNALYLPREVHSLLLTSPNPGGVSTADLIAYHLANAIYLNEAFGELHGPRLQLRVGRQLYRIGVGEAHRPTDLLNFTNPADPMWLPQGYDGVLLSVTPWRSLQLEGFASPGARFERSTWIARASASFGDWQFGAAFTHHWRTRTDWQLVNTTSGLAEVATVGLGRFLRDFSWNMPSAEVQGVLAGMRLRAEGGYAFIGSPTDSGTLTVASENHLRALVGADYTFPIFADGFHALVEYMYVGQAPPRARSLDINERIALTIGETRAQHTTYFSLMQALPGGFAAGLRGLI